MTWSSCVGVGDDRPDGFDVLLLTAFADNFGAGLRREDQCASLGPTVAEDDAFSDQWRISSLFGLMLSVSHSEIML